jgi:hypothetical protein
MERASLSEQEFEGKVGDVEVRWGHPARKRLQADENDWDENERQEIKAMTETAVYLSAVWLNQTRAKIL